jgi:hypothetical protein
LPSLYGATTKSKWRTSLLIHAGTLTEAGLGFLSDSLVQLLEKKLSSISASFSGEKQKETTK